MKIITNSSSMTAPDITTINITVLDPNSSTEPVEGGSVVSEVHTGSWMEDRLTGQLVSMVILAAPEIISGPLLTHITR